MINASNPYKRLRSRDDWAVCFSTCFFTSFVPARLSLLFQMRSGDRSLVDRKWTGAGLVGTAWGALTYVLLPRFIGQSFVALALGILFSVLVSYRAEKVLGEKDDARIIIDEWIGAWVAVWGLRNAITIPLLFALVLFRIFDVIKGPWIRKTQKLRGGWGVVMDDVLAGVFANLITKVIMLLTR